jgi:hypothetical protein
MKNRFQNLPFKFHNLQRYTAGSIAELSWLVFSIIPHEKAEAVTLVRG